MERYLKWFPDSFIEDTDTFVSGNKAAVFRSASGTYHGTVAENRENYWRLPVACKAEVKDEK